MPEFCSIESSNHILTVTLERPERLNALHPAANAELGKVFDDFAADDDLWVANVHTPPTRGAPLGRHVVRDAALAHEEHQRLAA